MSVAQVLRRARRLIERGDDESSWAASNIRTWAVRVMIEVCAARPEQIGTALRLLEHVALPAKANLDAIRAAHQAGRATAAEVAEAAKIRGAEAHLRDWLETDSRKLAEVLAALDTASLRARMLEGVDTST